MVWQDLVILVAQATCVVSLIPTLRDRSKWPPVSTTLPTGIALLAMASTFLTLGLYLSATLIFGLGGAWLYMVRPARD